MCGERNPEMLRTCIRRVVEGQIWADPTQMNYIVSALPSAHSRDLVAKRKLPNILSPREEKVVWHLAEGLTNREIAAQMQLSENTIKNYVFRIFEKLGFSNRVEVVLYAATHMQESSLAAAGDIQNPQLKPTNAVTTPVPGQESRSRVILQGGQTDRLTDRLDEPLGYVTPSHPE
jgi:DNA-binding CsgD family transcriptional regulator